MLSLLLPASISALKSQGVPAVQAGRVVVAVARLQSDRVAGWRVTLVAGHVGGSCRPIAQAMVSGRTRAQARHAAVALARQVASSLAGGELPPPLPPAPAVAAEPAAPYSTGAAEALEHVEIEALPTGGFLLTLTGAGYDGTCEHIPPHEAALWRTVEALSRLCGPMCSARATRPQQIEREGDLHARLLALLDARSVPTRRARHAA